MQIHNAAITGSFTYNGSDISNVSSSNAYSASFSTRITNTESTGSSLTTASGSFSTRVSNTESTGSSLTTASGSFSTRTTNLESTGSSLTTASGSFSTRITNIEGNYATTGSNVFLGAQTVCANITSTGTIIAQTINVQQVTSSIVYSSGSNIFGNLSSDIQQMTGSLRITGSLNTIGNACVTSICSPTFVGGTFCGTTVYGSTVVCGATICSTGNTCFGGNTIIAGCLGVGTATVSTNARLSVCGAIESMFDSVTNEGGHLTLRGQSTYLYRWNIDNKADDLRFFREDDATSANGCLALTITSARVACFANTVCAPNVSIINCLGVGTAAGAGYILDVYQPASSTTAYARIKNNRTRNAALQLETNCGNYLVGVGIGTDTNRFMIYDNNAGATRLTLDQCGNIGLSTTPAAWVSTARAFQINAYNSIASQHNGSFNIISEAYESAANTFAYGTTGGYPTRINMNPNDGVISIFNAPTGTATNTITWCERMRITSDGVVSINCNGSFGKGAKLQILQGSSNTNAIDFKNTDATYAHIGTFANNMYLTQNYYYAGGQYNDSATYGQAAITMGVSNVAGNTSIDFAMSDPGDTSPSSKMRLFSVGCGVLLVGTTTCSSEGTLFLGAKGSVEGGQLVLQKGTSYSCATHLDNYQDSFRIMSGTNTSSTTVNMSVNHLNGAATFYGNVTAYGYQSIKGTISLASGATGTIYNVGTGTGADGIYYVAVRVGGGSQIYFATGIVSAMASAPSQLFFTSLYDGANVTLSVNGSNIRITNDGFATLTWSYSIIFQPVD